MLKGFSQFLILVIGLSLTLNNLSYASFFGKKTKDSETHSATAKEKKKNEPTKLKSSKSVKKENEKVLVAEIYANWCPGCKNIQPTIDQLLKEVTDIQYVQLDVSTPSKAKASEKIAKELNITDFYEVNKSKTATVAIIIPFKKEVVSTFQNNNNIDDYKTAIQEGKTKQKALELKS